MVSVFGQNTEKVHEYQINEYKHMSVLLLISAPDGKNEKTNICLDICVWILLEGIWGICEGILGRFLEGSKSL